MRITRMTLVLPPRLRYRAEHDARLIAQAAAEQLGAGPPSAIRVELDGQGATGHGLAAHVGSRIGTVCRGRR